MDELTEDQKIIVNRARKVTASFLGQNYHVAKQFTGQDGVYVKIEDTVRSFDEILKGNCDEIPEQCFRSTSSIGTCTLLTRSFRQERVRSCR